MKASSIVCGTHYSSGSSNVEYGGAYYEYIVHNKDEMQWVNESEA